MVGEIAALIAAPALVDSGFRALLHFASRRLPVPLPLADADELLVVVPARDEGEHVRRTIESVMRARGERRGIRLLLLLDGPDETAASIAHELHAESIVKEPAGPTKAHALAWLAAHPVMSTADAILILDVGSTVPSDFFATLAMPEPYAAMQTMLRGRGEGVGEAAATSEAIAQSEDKGRSALQWNVRLRGTGSIFRRPAFDHVVPRQVTRVEDLECSLLLAAEGFTIGLVPATVFDEKPTDITSAASQRSRWILGRYELLFRHPGAFGRLLLRKPFEGLAFVAEIFGRPLSLTAPLRLIAGLLLFFFSSGWWLLLGGLLVVSGLADVVAHVRRPGGGRAAAHLFAAWMRALVMIPKALTRWMRAKRP